MLAKRLQMTVMHLDPDIALYWITVLVRIKELSN